MSARRKISPPLSRFKIGGNAGYRNPLCTRVVCVLLIGLVLICDGSAEVPPLSDQSTAAKQRYLDDTRPLVEQAWKEVLKSMSFHDRAKLKTVSIEYSLADAPLGFWSSSGKQPVITVSYGGLYATGALIKAQALYATEAVAQEWLIDYWAYTRKCDLQDKLPQLPTSLGNFSSKKVGTALSQSKIWEKSALFFVLAHEAFHILKGHRMDTVNKEEGSEHGIRLFMQEIYADEYATKLAVAQPDIGYGYLVLLSGVLRAYEPRRSQQIFDNPHQPDRERIKTLVDWITLAIMKTGMDFTARYGDLWKDLRELTEQMSERRINEHFKDRQKIIDKNEFPNLQNP